MELMTRHKEPDPNKYVLEHYSHNRSPQARPSSAEGTTKREIKKLPSEIEARFHASAAKGGEAWASGAVGDAESAFLEAWHAIPEPRLEYDYAQSMARGMVE